jgi:hypothetical protein
VSAEADPIRVLGHGGTALVGVLLVASGLAVTMSSLPMVLAVACVAFGAGALVLALASWRGSRMGWAFATTLDGVMAVCTLFGSTKIAHLMGIPLGAAVLPCALAGASCVALATLHADYDKS